MSIYFLAGTAVEMGKTIMNEIQPPWSLHSRSKVFLVLFFLVSFFKCSAQMQPTVAAPAERDLSVLRNHLCVLQVLKVAVVTAHNLGTVHEGAWAPLQKTGLSYTFSGHVEGRKVRRLQWCLLCRRCSANIYGANSYLHGIIT